MGLRDLSAFGHSMQIICPYDLIYEEFLVQTPQNVLTYTLHYSTDVPIVK